jgi:CRP-like cAMP-binding protein
METIHIFDKKIFLLQNIKSPLKEGWVMEEGKKDCSEAARENEERSEDGRDTLEDLTRGRPHLIKLLDQGLAVVEKQPGSWIFQEGEEVCRCCYIVLGKVEIVVAGEVVTSVASQELLGVDELLLREEHPIYTKAARVVEPTNLVWLDEDALVSIMGRGSLKGFLRLQARVAKQTAEALRRTNMEKDRADTTANQLRRALQVTQEELATRERLSRFPSRPKPAPPPPPPRKAGLNPEELQNRLRTERETNQNLVRLIERRDRELTEILGDLRQTIEQNSALAKSEALKSFVKRLESAVNRRENTVIALKPL